MKGMSLNEIVERCNTDEISKLLLEFFPSIKNLKKATIESIKYGLRKYFLEIKPSFDILTNPELAEVLKCLMKSLKEQGLGSTTHIPKIEDADLQLILTTNDGSSPVKLQYFVWFYFQIYFCRRGCENTAGMLIEDFDILRSSDGREYIIKIKDEIQKNHRSDEEHSVGGRIYAVGGDKCPVALFKLYLSKLNKRCPRLWQNPKQTFLEEEDVWYENKPVGKAQFPNSCRKYRA